jgi:hypothetical protein
MNSWHLGLDASSLQWTSRELHPPSHLSSYHRSCASDIDVLAEKLALRSTVIMLLFPCAFVRSFGQTVSSDVKRGSSHTTSAVAACMQLCEIQAANNVTARAAFAKLCSAEPLGGPRSKTSMTAKIRSQTTWTLARTQLFLHSVV